MNDQPLNFCAFVMNTPSHIIHGLWRDPEGEQVRYNAVTPAAYSAFGFPGADELANMFQFNAEFAGEYCATRNLTTSRSLHPNLTSYTRWLEHNAASIPLA